MGDWKLLKQVEIDAGGNNFIEVSLKQPPEGEGTLVAISKGWKTSQDEKRYKANILFSPEKVDELIEVLKSVQK
jgi:hypothetical protein